MKKINDNKKVLVVATSHLTRGGISAVINAHKTGEQWQKFDIRWIETHIDRTIFHKLLYFFRSCFQFMFCISQYDLVHIHLSQPVSVKRKLFFIYVAKHKRKKIIIHLHSPYPDEIINKRNKKLYQWTFNHSDTIIVISEIWKKLLTDKLNVIPPVIVLHNPAININNNYNDFFYKKPYILFAGTINERKGYSLLIRSFKEIAHKYPKWKIIFAGNGEIEKGKQLAKKMGIINQIEFCGWIRDDEKDRLFRVSSIFCLPSYGEGFPMSVLDAWAYGLPVITTPVGGLIDILQHGVNAMVFEPGDIVSLTNNLEILINNIELRRKLSFESHKLIKNKFNIENIVNELDRIYSSLLL